MKNTLACFFKKYLKVIITKKNITIRLLRNLKKSILRPVLVTMYKSFVRPYLSCCDIIYDEVYNKNFIRNLNLFNTMPA